MCAVTEAQLSTWIRREAAALGCAFRTMRSSCSRKWGESLYAVKRELEKLAAYVSSERSVQAAEVEALRGPSQACRCLIC